MRDWFHNLREGRFARKGAGAQGRPRRWGIRVAVAVLVLGGLVLGGPVPGGSISGGPAPGGAVLAGSVSGGSVLDGSVSGGQILGGLLGAGIRAEAGETAQPGRKATGSDYSGMGDGRPGPGGEQIPGKSGGPQEIGDGLVSGGPEDTNLSDFPPLPPQEETLENDIEPEEIPIQETQFTRGELSFQVEYGFEGRAKGGRYLPVEVTIDNAGNVPVTGSLRIQSMESDDTLYRYDYQADVAAMDQVVLKEYIPLGSRARQLYVSYVDSQGQELAGQRIRLSVSLDVPELFIGVLSDRPETLKYLDGVGVSYGTLRTRTFELDETQFPREEMGLSLLDVLVVNNYKLRSLSEEQTAAIMDWVHSGGVLILGTGERVDDTLGRFAPELLDDSYGLPELRQVDLGESYSQGQILEGMVEMACVDIPLHGGNVILSSGGFPLLTAAAKEQGLIGVAAFDLADIAPFCERQTAYVDYFLTSLLGESRISRLAQVVYSGNSGRFWSVQSLINTGNLERLPRMLPYGVVLALYILIMGPVLYVFLKNRELQIYYRSGVVVLSLIFTVVVYLMGSATRFDSTFYTYATIQDVTEDYVTDSTYVNIRNPYNRPYRVQLNPSYSILPVTRSSWNQDGQERAFTGQEACQIVIGRGDGELVLEGQRIAAFSPRYFQMGRKSPNTGRVGITGEAHYFEGSLSGTITSQFPFPLENAALILYGNVIYLGRLEPQETIRLDDLEMLRFPLNNSQVVAEYITGEKVFQNADIQDLEYLTAMQRARMLTFYLDNYMTGYMADARVVAFSTAKEESQFLEEENPETYGLTMVTSAIGVDAYKDRVLYRSVLMKTPEVVTGTYDQNTNSMTSLEPLTLEYQMGTDITVESLTFEPVSDELRRKETGDAFEIFEGGIYFYNHGSGNFERMELENRTMDVEELRPYLSPGNILTVRYVYEGTGGFDAVQLPMPMVAGREN